MNVPPVVRMRRSGPGHSTFDGAVVDRIDAPVEARIFQLLLAVQNTPLSAVVLPGD